MINGHRHTQDNTSSDVEQAYSFNSYFCDDPRRDHLHLTLERRDGSPICEMIVGRDTLRRLVRHHWGETL